MRARQVTQPRHTLPSWEVAAVWELGAGVGDRRGRRGGVYEVGRQGCGAKGTILRVHAPRQGWLQVVVSGWVW